MELMQMEYDMEKESLSLIKMDLIMKALGKRIICGVMAD